MDKLKVGVLGLRRGLSHLRNFLNTEGVEVIGAADRIEQWRDRAAEAAADAGGRVRFVAEFDELLELRPDAVAIASNGRQQAAHAIQASARETPLRRVSAAANSRQAATPAFSRAQHSAEFSNPSAGSSR